MSWSIEACALPDELLTQILAEANVITARAARCVCKRWCDAAGGLDLSLCLVTASGSNEIILLDAQGRIVQRVKAMPPTKRQRRGTSRTYVGHSSWRAMKTHQWPTCMASGPNGELLVSQYRVQGLLQFARCSTGYVYQRTLVSHPRFASPEGVVWHGDSIYLCAVDRGTISRISAGDGRVLEETVPYEQIGEFYVLWGMCLGPDGRSLYIAAHVSEEGGDYEQPTHRNTGCLLLQRLTPGGAFDGPTRHFAGYPFPGVHYNRPSDPAFCSHGCVHISTFERPGSSRRVVLKIISEASNGLEPGDCVGFLQVEPTCDALLHNPWGLSFGTSDAERDVLVASCHTPCVDEAHGTAASVVRVDSCGCACGSLLQPPPASTTSSSPPLSTVCGRRLQPRACGRAVALVGSLQQANYVMHLTR